MDAQADGHKASHKNSPGRKIGKGDRALGGQPFLLVALFGGFAIADLCGFGGVRNAFATLRSKRS